MTPTMQFIENQGTTAPMPIGKNVVHIFDTTLRDGEQAPGFTMNAEEKLRMAKQLTELGVDVIEAGFAASSPGDFESVHEIGHTLKGPRVVSLCRTNLEDIDAGIEALKGSHSWGIHTFIASSALHMKYKLNMEPNAVVNAAVRAVEKAKRVTDHVEFSPEDATRSDKDFLVRLCNAAIAAGASVINIPDTVGYTTPIEMDALIDRLMNEVKGAENVVFSVHCHNDLGLAVANSIAAVRAGARQIECTINGIGERAGNASLEEIVMALKTRKDFFDLETNIKSQEIMRSSRMLTQITGMPVQSNKAIVGANAFAHEAGIHQDGVLKNPLTYEIMTPDSVGLKESQLVLGKHSGRHALADRAKILGYELSRQEVNTLFNAFKRLADLKKVVYDEDIEALITQNASQDQGRYRLVALTVHSGTEQTPVAQVEMEIEGELTACESQGDGPVDAAFSAIKQLTQVPCTLKEYRVKGISDGADAQGEVTTAIVYEGKSATGRGLDPDIIVASAKAFVSALNRLRFRAKRNESI